MTETTIPLDRVSREDIPSDLRPATYFDFMAHPFAHQDYVSGSRTVYDAIRGIDKYARTWLARHMAASPLAPVESPPPPLTCRIVGRFLLRCDPSAVFLPALILGPAEGPVSTISVDAGARVLGAYLYLDSGDIHIGSDSLVEPGAGIRGPAIIGQMTEIRQGAYLRGGCLIGNHATLRGEIKNSILMDRATFPHPSYLGDSICGFMSHFGNQATTANLGLYAGLVDSKRRKPVFVRCQGQLYELGGPKMGICMGDFSQVGCNSVSDPGTFLKPYTIVYPLTRIKKGFYGPREILKNKPFEHGVIERSPLAPYPDPQ